MTGVRYNDPSSPLFKRLNILKLKDLFEQQVKLNMYDFVNTVLPEPLYLEYMRIMEIYMDMRLDTALTLNPQI